jgi:hypothetical protein
MQRRIFFAHLAGHSHLIQLHVQLEDLFEQISRNAGGIYLVRACECSSPISEPSSFSRYSVRCRGSFKVR